MSKNHERDYIKHSLEIQSTCQPYSLTQQHGANNDKPVSAGELFLFLESQHCVWSNVGVGSVDGIAQERYAINAIPNHAKRTRPQLFVHHHMETATKTTSPTRTTTRKQCSRNTTTAQQQHNVYRHTDSASKTIGK